jgi:hypothetical protein
MWEDKRDGPDEVFHMTSEAVAVEGDTAVVRVEVRYGTPAGQEYRDLWIMRFAEDGRCSSFGGAGALLARLATARHSGGGAGGHCRLTWLSPSRAVSRRSLGRQRSRCRATSAASGRPRAPAA